ncbi:amino acid hydroxylase [Skermania sp. ID1734]|nr:amino acid hydroxylase [Skermania sp. ID1734]
MTSALGIRAERQRIASEFRPGDPIPQVSYTGAEDELWMRVFGKLSAMHHGLACAQYLESSRRVALPTDRVPQLTEISRRLLPLTGFQLTPASGTVPSQPFYAPFANGIFQATLYLRRPSALFYSAEPDLIHDLIGHAAMLADPDFAEIYRWFGYASRRASIEQIRQLARLFWFTLETGVLMENGRPRACGAAILSSVSEMESFLTADLRPFRVADIIAQDFDDSDCQPVLFVADSVRQIRDGLLEYMEIYAH